MYDDLSRLSIFNKVTQGIRCIPPGWDPQRAPQGPYREGGNCRGGRVFTCFILSMVRFAALIVSFISPNRKPRTFPDPGVFASQCSLMLLGTCFFSSKWRG